MGIIPKEQWDYDDDQLTRFTKYAAILNH